MDHPESEFFLRRYFRYNDLCFDKCVTAPKKKFTASEDECLCKY